MQSLKENNDVVVYIKSLLNEGFSLPYYSIVRLLKVYNYTICDIEFVEPSSKQQRLTISSIKEKEDGVSLIVFEKSWVNYLPVVYRNDTLESFLYGFQLTMFKQVEVIDNMEELFIPEKTPDEFVAWLASWFNISFSNEIKLENRRRVIYRLTELYNAKGTKNYLIDMVQLLTDITIDIKERVILEGSGEYNDIDKNLSFVVSILAEPIYQNAKEEKQLHAIVKNIIETEKPIFTNALFDSSFILDGETLISKPVVKEKEPSFKESKYLDTVEKKSEKEEKKEDENQELDEDSDYDDFG